MAERMRAALFFNGTGLVALALLLGWVWFFALLGRVVLWPLPIDIVVSIRMTAAPGAWHTWRRSPGTAVDGLRFGGQYMRLSRRQFSWLFWSALTSTWLFTLGAAANAICGTRGLAFGGGPFKPGLAND